MLVELHITDFALVDDLRLDTAPGFNVLTGETGAGKSIVVDAVNAALGERTTSDAVRTGASKAVVEAVFDVSSCPQVAQTARDLGFDPDDGILILSREIVVQGKSQARINGRPATTSAVREISSRLVDIHGQHEHQSLLQTPLHIDVFDSWCGDDVSKLRGRTETVHAELIELLGEREKFETDQRERARALDLYKFEQSEIEAAGIEEGEEDELVEERNRLANAEKLREAAAEAYQALSTEGGGVDALGAAAASAERIVEMDASAKELSETLNAALFGAQEALASVREYREDVEANPQ